MLWRRHQPQEKTTQKQAKVKADEIRWYGRRCPLGGIYGSVALTSNSCFGMVQNSLLGNKAGES